MQNYHDARETLAPEPGAVCLSFDRGTIVVDGWPADVPLAYAVWDERVMRWRSPAYRYRHILGAILRAGKVVWDNARKYEPVVLKDGSGRVSFLHQQSAFEAWEASGKTGVVVLPTGAGKSHIAVRAIEAVGRSALVIAPTLDLVDQWVRLLEDHFGCPVGALGGGSFDPQNLTVSTYDSAAIHMDHLGGRFGLLVFDEVHHLPSKMYRWAAEASIAPYRLGLSATPERPDGLHTQLDDLVGPEVFRLSPRELAGDILAEYRTEVIEVAMDEADAQAYLEAREVYRSFVRDHGVRLGGKNGWQNFLRAAAGSEQGRVAFRAHRRARQLALSHQLKLAKVAEILARHEADRTIVFTNDNASVYEISERLLCPALTHQTPLKERGEILRRFSDGTYRVVVTSRVLNEGVDVPEASVAIVLSGTGSVREHVQRLGRILRRGADKQALLYELVTPDSVETHVSQRRRTHDAYE